MYIVVDCDKRKLHCETCPYFDQCESRDNYKEKER